MAQGVSPLVSEKNRVRVGGSGFTLFTFKGQPIAFCQEVAHTSPRPVGQGASAIQPMDEPYPIEIITPAAAGMGQLVLNLFELFGHGGHASKVWDRLGAGHATGLGTPFNDTSVGNISTAQAIQAAGAQTPFAGAVDIVDIFIRQAMEDPKNLTITKIIRPLSAGGNIYSGSKFYTEEYNGCVVTDVTDGEQINVGTLEVIKQITVAYRFVTRNSNPSAAFAMRDGSISIHQSLDV